jgi:hypothetical protein
LRVIKDGNSVTARVGVVVFFCVYAPSDPIITLTSKRKRRRNTIQTTAKTPNESPDERNLTGLLRETPKDLSKETSLVVQLSGTLAG